MKLVGIDNAFGTDVFQPPVNTESHTFYYRGLRLTKTPVRIPAAPKPLSHTLRNFLLNFNK